MQNFALVKYTLDVLSSPALPSPAIGRKHLQNFDATPDQQGSQVTATWHPPRLACRADAASSCASLAGAVTADCAHDWGGAQVAASATADHSRVDHGHADFA